jgi:hypothetical protein
MRPIVALVVLSAAGCGFECEVQGEKEFFGDCAALQAAFDEEQSRLDPPPNAARLDDLNTCGDIHGCELAQ